MVVLLAYAIALDPMVESTRWWFVAALVFSLAGDVFLMLPSNRFVEGLASFLVGHLAYIAGLVAWGLSIGPAWFGLVALLAAFIITIGGAIVQAAGEQDRRLRMPVAVYITAITVMVLAAGATGHWWFLVGALSFYASDAMIGISRFVRDFRASGVAIMVTYHLAQFLLVYGLTQ
jgi:uncharacterized membrane protein YhhN